MRKSNFRHHERVIAIHKYVQNHPDIELEDGYRLYKT